MSINTPIAATIIPIGKEPPLADGCWTAPGLLSGAVASLGAAAAFLGAFPGDFKTSFASSINSFQL